MAHRALLLCLAPVLFLSGVAAAQPPVQDGPLPETPVPAADGDTAPAAEVPAAEAIPAPDPDEDSGAGEEAAPWTGSVSFGGTLTMGNTETLTIAATFDAVKDAVVDGRGRRKTLKSWFNYGSQDNGVGLVSITERKAGSSVQLDQFLTGENYYLATGLAETDELADLDLRWSVGLGAGRRMRNTDKLDLSVEAGLSFFAEEFETAASDQYFASRFAYTLAWKVSDTTQFDQSFEVYPSVEDLNDIYSKLDSTLRVDITDRTFLQLQWVLDYDNTPAPGNDRLDHRFVVAYGWSF